MMVVPHTRKSEFLSQKPHTKPAVLTTAPDSTALSEVFPYTLEAGGIPGLDLWGLRA